MTYNMIVCICPGNIIAGLEFVMLYIKSNIDYSHNDA